MLTYSAITSLDGFVADEQGDFAWGMPDAEVHRFVNDLARPATTHLYGRRMYDVLAAWEDPAMLADDEPAIQDFARIWLAADKVVYSRTLDAPRTARTRLEREFEPAAVAALKAEQEVAIGGPHLAAEAFRAGLVDEVGLTVMPVVVGAGNPALPADARLDLDLRSVHHFEARGAVHLQYAVRR